MKLGKQQPIIVEISRNSLQNGDNVITLHITCDDGAKDLKIKAMKIGDITASFIMSSNKVYLNENVYFTNTATNAENYLWDFGDGKTSTITSPSHSYNDVGNYTIKLTAYSGSKSNEHTERIKVNEKSGNILFWTNASFLEITFPIMVTLNGTDEYIELNCSTPPECGDIFFATF